MYKRQELERLEEANDAVIVDVYEQKLDESDSNPDLLIDANKSTSHIARFLSRLKHKLSPRHGR